MREAKPSALPQITITPNYNYPKFTINYHKLQLPQLQLPQIYNKLQQITITPITITPITITPILQLCVCHYLLVG